MNRVRELRLGERAAVHGAVLAHLQLGEGQVLTGLHEGGKPLL